MSKELATYNAYTDLVMARLRSPKVKDTPEPEAQAHVGKLIQAACMARGTSMDKQGRDVTAALLVAQMRQEKLLADLTWEEVDKAIQEGTFGKYGEVYGINAVSLCDMLWGYIESQERATLIKTERELKYGVSEANAAKTNSFLDAHPEYAKIVLNNYIEQHLINK